MKCPQCQSLLDARPGDEARCGECGYRGPVASPSGSKRASQREAKTREAPASGREVVAPLAFLAGLGGLATFYLAAFWVPLLLSLAGVAGGLWSHERVAASPQSLAAAGLGGLGLVLGVVVLAVA